MDHQQTEEKIRLGNHTYINFQDNNITLSQEQYHIRLSSRQIDQFLFNALVKNWKKMALWETMYFSNVKQATMEN